MFNTMVRILERFFKKSTLFKFMFNLSPVYRRSTGRLYFVSDDLQTIKVKIPLSYRNRNYVGTMFGGSMTSATDPIFMIQLITILGSKYVVWDKSSTIRFRRPGKQTLYADFIVTTEFLNQIKKDIDQHNEKDYTLSIDLKDKEGRVYAEIEKVIYIASKKYFRAKKKKK